LGKFHDPMGKIHEVYMIRILESFTDNEAEVVFVKPRFIYTGVRVQDDFVVIVSNETHLKI